MPRKPNQQEWPHTNQERIELTPAIMEGFVSLYLLDRFDSPKPIPDLHRQIWDMFCSTDPYVAIAAPRGHAKSSAGTHAFCLASILFGFRDHILILSATERMASDHLCDVAIELEENQDLIEQFHIRLLISNDTEIIGYVGGRMFRVIAKGAEQKVRGIKWRHKRPNLILIDDLEDDEAVESLERRIKLREWIDNAVLPLGSDDCLIRALGTVLHFDSWLERVLNSSAWVTRRFEAHADFDDFSDILWPEKFPEERLRRIRQIYIDANNPSGYAKEYLNRPIAELDSYFHRDDFIPMEDKDYDSPKNYYVGGDFAISTKDRANSTAFTVGGVDPDNILHIVDCRTGRWDSLQIIDEMFRIQAKYKPDMWILEKGQIELAIGPFLDMEMMRRNVYLNIMLVSPSKDKPLRARSIQARMRAKGVRFDKRASWYNGYELEMLQFPKSSRDDRPDSTAYIGMFLDQTQSSLTVKELLEIEEELEEQRSMDDGRSQVTGY